MRRKHIPGWLRCPLPFPSISGMCFLLILQEHTTPRLVFFHRAGSCERENLAPGCFSFVVAKTELCLE
jgi:hypothetical protein